MTRAEPKCDFCGLCRGGGVAGASASEAYICRDCVQLTHQMIDGPPLGATYRTGLVNLYTGDIEAALHFSADLLGFRESFRTPADGVPEHVELGLDGLTLGLGTVEAARRVHGVEPAPGAPALAVVVWTDDVDAAFAELVAHGVPVVKAPHDTGTNHRNALLRDPDGNLVEIVATRIS